MHQACPPHSGQRTLGEREPIEIRSWFERSVTCSIWSPSHKGRNNDTSILIHLVLQRGFLCRTRENVNSIQREQAGTLNVGKSLFPGVKNKVLLHFGISSFLMAAKGIKVT